MDRLLDRAVDIALLRHLALGGRRWQGPEVVREALDWILPDDVPTQRRNAQATGAYSTLRSLVTAGIVETRRDSALGGSQFRLVEGVSLRRFTGGIDPVRISQEEARELDGVERPVITFQPDTYRKARTAELKCERALWQCPSPWAYAARIKSIT